MPRRRDQSCDRLDESAIIANLAARFAAFRRTHRRFARIPRDLRAEVVASLRRGVSPGRLCTTCRVSTSQLALWRRAAGAGAPSSAGDPGARIFSVVEETPTPAPGSVGVVSAASDALELRLGPWAVSVRLVGQQPVGRR